MENIKTQKERIGQLQTENETLKQNEASKEDELDKLQVTLRYSCIHNRYFNAFIIYRKRIVINCLN